MEPIGLTLKELTYNPFTQRTSGELMVVHLCLNCDRISCNRIAGDDNSHVIVCLLEKPSNLSGAIISKLTNQNIRLLTQSDKRKVLTILYGYDYVRTLK